MLEVGNCCYINNDYSKLWLIVAINNDLILVKNLKEEQVIHTYQISEIIEN